MNVKGINQDRQKENNIKQIIHLLYRTESCSRVSLANIMNLTQAAITKLVNPLIGCGLVEEVQLIETASGRKPKQLKLVPNRFAIISGRINRDYISVALYNLRGNLLCDYTEPIEPRTSPETAFERFKAMISGLTEKTTARILGIGIAVPGPFNMFSNTVTLMSGFSGWDRIDIKSGLEKEFNLPVFLEQDANCGAIAELWCGNRSLDDFIYVTADRGVGSGIVIDGRIYRGNVGYAGEFGHMSISFNGPECECGNHGCLELYCSTTALEAEYNRAVFNENSKVATGTVQASDILGLVRENDPIAKASYDAILKYLAFGCASLINILNPDAIVFADKITYGGGFFLTTMRKYLKQFLMPELFERLAIDVSHFTGDPTILGASVLVLDQMLEKNFEFFLKN
ncbi:MAG: ROK family protein [Sphaerochaetaceae bacterium]